MNSHEEIRIDKSHMESFKQPPSRHLTEQQIEKIATLLEMTRQEVINLTNNND